MDTVGENMSKLYGALDDVRDDPELQVPTNSLVSDARHCDWHCMS